MKYFIGLLSLICLSLPASAQSSHLDSGTFIIHKFAQAIGKEKYSAARNGDRIIYNIDFKYTDRGSPVHLKDSIVFSKNMEPLAYRIKGGTSRFTTVNDSVSFKGPEAQVRVNDSSYVQNINEKYFPIAGYSPATAQMLLIQFWLKHQSPANIVTPPFGSVKIFRDGTDTISFEQKQQAFLRYHITGLIWGNELLWTTPEGQLICLITNDAEGDKQEIVFAPYESLLTHFIQSAAIRGMQLFTVSRDDSKSSMAKNKLIAITHATVLDVVNSTLLTDATVLIENGKIKKVGKTVSVPAQAEVIDGKGKFVLPGLWDMHSHFEQAEWGPAYLAAGVTTVRDCGNEFDYINAVKKTIDYGNGIGPLILKAGIIDGKGPYALGVVQADTKEEAVAAVRMYKENGFVQIKIYSSVKPAIVKAICAEAHTQGLTVTGHIPFMMNTRQAIDSGMNMINHIDYVVKMLNVNKTDGTIDFTDTANIAAISFLKAHQVVVDPTLGVYEMIFRSVKDNIQIVEPHFSSLPEPLKPLFSNMGLSDSTEIAQGKKRMAACMQTVFQLNKSGIPLVAGTDMDFPGYSLFREIELYVAAGLTPMEAIRAATIVPARVMKLDQHLGSVEEGKKADLIIVNGNPLTEIRNIRNVQAVIKDGVMYNPEKLHELAGFSKN